MPQSLLNLLFDPTVARIIIALLAILALVVLVRLSHRALGRRIQDADTRYRARKFTTLAGWLFGFGVLAVIFSDRLGGLHVALGLAGAGLAFALQEVIVSTAGWLAISLSSYFKIGDRVRLAGVKGDVIDIGVLRTTLMEIGEWVDGDLYTGRVVRVANSFVFKEPVFNYSGDFPFLWDELTLPIRHGSDLDFAREVIKRTAAGQVGDYAAQAEQAWDALLQKYRIENAQVEPMVTMTANENWVVFTLRYVVDYRQRRTTKDRLYARILSAIDATGGKVAVACSTLEVTMAPPVGIPGSAAGEKPGSGAK